jgi:phenylacetate-coenzyme A ligase PaaK-like adenylate-forming protein
MTAQHYIFGQLEEAPLTVTRTEEILGQAASLSLRPISIREILDVLDQAGRSWRDPNYPLRRQARERLPELVGFSAEMVDRGFHELGRLLDRHELQSKLTHELGRTTFLDGWTWSKGYDGYLRATPLGVVTHVSPGNVFLGAADSLVHGLLTKNINIVKVSRGDPLFPLLFAQSLKEADRGGRIASSFCIMTLPEEGREEIESRLKTRSDGIVIWGGGEAVAAWSSGAADGVKVIPYGPRFSFSMVSAEHLDATPLAELPLNGLVEDVISWETRACGSPQVLFWPSAHSHLLPNLLDLLIPRFQEWASLVPPPQHEPDVSVELRREFELTRFLAVEGQAQAVAAPDLSWSVQVRPWEEHRVSPLHRTLIVVPYPDLSTLCEWLRPLRHTLQSVGLAADPPEFRSLGLQLTDLGVHRLTEWGKMWKAKHGSPHDGAFQLAQLIRWSTIESLPGRFDAEKRLKPKTPAKTRKLAALLDYARARSDYYRSVLPEVELAGARDLVLFPRLDAETLRQNTPPAGKALLTGTLEGAYIFASGGSTGAPKFSFYALEEWEEVTDILSAIYQKASVNKGDTVANLFMAGNLWTSFLAASEALEKLGCIKLPIAGNVDPESIMAYLQMFRPSVLLGLPSLLVRLAELLEEKGQRLDVRTVLYGGEALSREARAYLQEILGATTVASAGYASVDAGPIGYQTLDLPVGYHYLLYDYQFLEFLDPESGEPVADGQVGEITVTCLGRRLMPLIRYRTGDLGRWVDSANRLFELKGRIGDRIRVGTADIYPADVARVLDGIEGAGHIFQIVISKKGMKDHVEVHVERSTRNSPRAESQTVKQALLGQLEEAREAYEKGWIEDFVVDLVPQGSLQGMRRTGKIRAVVDLR